MPPSLPVRKAPPLCLYITPIEICTSDIFVHHLLTNGRAFSVTYLYKMDIKKCILFVFLFLATHFVKSEDEDIEIFEQCQGRAQRKIGWPVINQKRKTIKKSMKKNHKVTCPELNNVTFTDKKPFNILGVPKCLKHKLVMELFINDYLQAKSLHKSCLGRHFSWIRK